jgi:hypothetical protein
MSIIYPAIFVWDQELVVSFTMVDDSRTGQTSLSTTGVYFQPSKRDSGQKRSSSLV